MVKTHDNLSTRRTINYGLMVFCVSIFLPLIIHSVVTLPFN